VLVCAPDDPVAADIVEEEEAGERVFAPFGQCVGAVDVARPPVDIRPPEVGAGDGGKGLDGTAVFAWWAWCFGGIAELLSDIAEGAIAAGGADGGGAAVRGPDSADPPGFGPGFWAQTGAENASAATTATPVKRCFIVLILPCNLRGAVWGPHKAQLAFHRPTRLRSQDGS
jgi:hypothetical protein